MCAYSSCVACLPLKPPSLLPTTILPGDVVFGTTLDGRAVAPAARMSQMTYPASYVNAVSMFEFGMREWERERIETSGMRE